MAATKKESVKTTTQVTITLPNKVYEQLLRESDKYGINRSAYMTMALKEKWLRESANTPSSVA